LLKGADDEPEDVTACASKSQLPAVITFSTTRPENWDYAWEDHHDVVTRFHPGENCDYKTSSDSALKIAQVVTTEYITRLEVLGGLQLVFGRGDCGQEQKRTGQLEKGWPALIGVSR